MPNGTSTLPAPALASLLDWVVVPEEPDETLELELSLLEPSDGFLVEEPELFGWLCFVFDPCKSDGFGEEDRKKISHARTQSTTTATTNHSTIQRPRRKAGVSFCPSIVLRPPHVMYYIIVILIG